MAREISCKIWETREIFPILHSAPYDNNYITHCFYVDKKLFELFRIETEMPPSVYVIILFRTVQGYLEMIHFYTK